MNYQIIEIVADFGITHIGSIRFNVESKKYFISYSSMWSNHIPHMIIDDERILSDKLKLSNIYKKHISEFIYLEGIISLLQISGRYKKKDMSLVYKMAKISQKNNVGALNERLIKSKITKRFNIESELPLIETIKLVNELGYQKLPMTIVGKVKGNKNKTRNYLSYANFR